MSFSELTQFVCLVLAEIDDQVRGCAAQASMFCAAAVVAPLRYVVVAQVQVVLDAINGACDGGLSLEQVVAVEYPHHSLSRGAARSVGPHG